MIKTKIGLGLRKYNFLVMLIPVLIFYTLFVAYPFIYSLILSLYKWPGVGPKTFVGFKNYVDVLTGYLSQEVIRSFLHNVLFFVISWVSRIVPGLVLAFCLSYGLRGTEFFKTVFFIPNVLSVFIVGFLWGLLLNPQWGMVNQILRVIGLSSWAKPWLGEPAFALPMIILVLSWAKIGLYILVFLAGIIGIDRDLFDAARIDGASEMQIMTKIVIPQLVPLIGTLTVLTFIWSFNTFDIIFAMEGPRGGPAGATDVLGLLFYRLAFGAQDSAAVGMGVAATVVSLIFLFAFPISILYVYILEKREKAE